MHEHKFSEQPQPATAATRRQWAEDMYAHLEGLDEAVDALEAKLSAAKTRRFDHDIPDRNRVS